MKILVTGGAGFIGSHVIDTYIKAGHRVSVVDDLSSGFRKNLNPKAKFYRIDIRNLAAVKKTFKKEKPWVVSHHAAVSEVTRSLKDPGLTHEVNILGTANVLIAAGEAKIKKFVFASTGGALYGNPDKIPVGESAEARPLSPYAVSKLAGEKMVEFYSRLCGFNHLILRYSNVYGPRQNPKGEAGVMAIFTDIMKRGRRPRIFGDGTKTRDYVFIDDVVRANVNGLARGRNIAVNISSGQETKDREVFDAIARRLKFKDRPIYGHFRKGEVYRIALKNNLAKKVLNWRPHISFEQGIARYIDFALAKK